LLACYSLEAVTLTSARVPNGHGNRPVLPLFGGWSIADHMGTELVIDALQGAARTGCEAYRSEAIFHFDQGRSTRFPLRGHRFGLAVPVGPVYQPAQR
jgi:hypothetical protein